MQFRREQACGTLLAAADALAAGWHAVRPETRCEVEALIREFGRKLALADPQNRVGDVLYLLRGLAGLVDRLPAGVGVALRAGAGAASRTLVLVSDEQRDDLLEALVRVYDARHYRLPAGLARRVGELIAGHQDLLTAHEVTGWTELEDAYIRTGDPVAYLDGVAALLPHVEVIQQLLATNRDWAPVRSGAAFPDGAPVRTAAEACLAVAQRPPLTASVHFPATVLLSQRMVPFVVHISRSTLEGASNAAALQPRPGMLTLLLSPEGFAISSIIGGRPSPGGSPGRILAAAGDADCEPVVFFLDPQAPGPKRITLDIYQAGAVLASLRVDTRVVCVLAPGEGVEPAGAQPASLRQSDPDVAEPPDLELRVILLGDGRTLSFVLHSHNGDYNFRPVGTVTLRGEPQGYFDTLLLDLSRLARMPQERNEAITREASRRIHNAGMRLYDELLPAEFRREYAETIRHKYAGGTLLITSDEPWIPWEMVRPFEVQGGRVLFNDPPLAENFKLARWLAGRGAPSRLTISRGAVVAPPGNLAAVRSELDYFAELQRRKWNLALTGPLTRVAEVLEQIEDGGAQLLHLSTHGNFEPGDPRSSALKLADGYLRPVQLLGAAQAGIERSAPLVFVNACHAGQNGLLLTRLGGWADSFLSAGAGVFIGSLWEINDVLAAHFARAFYDLLFGLAGRPAMPIAEAFREARLAIKAIDPANPTWLAYVLYASPNTRVTLV